MNKHKHIGTVIAELRESRTMSQAEVAKSLQVDVTTVAAWENGAETPDSDTLLHLALLFGVSRDVLDVENPSENTEQKKIEKDQDLVKIICRAVALAMGIAVTVLSILNSPLKTESAIAMLGIGLTCLGIASFTKKK